MIYSKDIKSLIAHPAIMQQKTLIKIIQRHNKKLKPAVTLWVRNNKIPDAWVAIINKIPELKSIDFSETKLSAEYAKSLAISRFNDFVESSRLGKVEIAYMLDMQGDCGQGVQRWKKTGVGKESVEKFVEVFGESGGYWRPDLGYLRFEK